MYSERAEPPEWAQVWLMVLFVATMLFSAACHRS